MRQVGKLTALAVSRASKPGRYGDGGGLWLVVGRSGAKSWELRFMLNGKARHMGLGPLHTVSLADARERARTARQLLLDGRDPIDARRQERLRAQAEAARLMTFDEAARAFVEAHAASWRNAKHRYQWSATLGLCSPAFGDLPVGAVETADVLRVLEPIWTAKPETASRLRGRVERVLDWAKARGYREGENPARWRGHLDHLLPRLPKAKRVKHHPALPFAEVGDFMAELRRQSGVAALALEFTILTAARTGEVLGARPGEIVDSVWTVPADRMKGGKEHRVPLSAEALAVLERAAALGGDGVHIFPGLKKGRPLSNMAMLAVLRRMGREDLTVHGFRSSFRDWTAEQTAFPREVAEQALAHTLADRVEAAYRRGDLFEKRRRLMAAWARFCGVRKAPGTPGAAAGQVGD